MTENEKKLIADFRKEQQSWLTTRNIDNLFRYKEAMEHILAMADSQPTFDFTDSAAVSISELGQVLYAERAPLSYAMSNSIIRFLSNYYRLEELFAEQPLRDGLLWVMFDQATTYTYQPATGYEQYVRHVLYRITSQPLAGDVLPTVDVVATHLYGPAVWELYGQKLSRRLGEDDMCQIIHGIISLSLPFCSDEPSAHPIATIELPGNITF